MTDLDKIWNTLPETSFDDIEVREVLDVGAHLARAAKDRYHVLISWDDDGHLSLTGEEGITDLGPRLVALGMMLMKQARQG
jgi:hypothetical protein